MSEQAVKSKVFGRQTKEWMAFFTQTVSEIRESCKYIRNNSTRQKGKKNSGLTISKFWAQRYGDIRLESLKGKKRRTLHAEMMSEGTNGRPAGKSRDMNPLETI